VRRFLAWLGATAIAFGGLGVATHFQLSAHPRRVAVVVDTSFEMNASRGDVALELERLAGARYAEFSLLTDKLRVHGWQRELETAPPLSFYGPQDLSLLADERRYPELSQADRVVVITNARDTAAVKGLRGVRVVGTR
jgi:hypothetical protein